MGNNYAAGVAKWAEKSHDEVEEIWKSSIFMLFRAVIKDTPVDTGRLRGNWILSANSPKFGELEITDPSGAKKEAELNSLVASLDINKAQKVYMTNSLPYAYRIEYLGWSHTKAPDGMVRKNFVRISQLLSARYGI